MSSIDHLRTCEYCRRIEYENVKDKPTIRVKGASSYNRTKNLSELAAIITGRSFGILSPTTETKGASVLCSDKNDKLKELGKMVKGL